MRNSKHLKPFVSTQALRGKTRSSLERDWIAFFEAQGIDYAYEPCAFSLGNTAYLPDFYISKAKTFIEVKGRLREGDCEKMQKFSKAAALDGYMTLIVRNITFRNRGENLAGGLFEGAVISGPDKPQLSRFEGHRWDELEVMIPDGVEHCLSCPNPIVLVYGDSKGVSHSTCQLCGHQNKGDRFGHRKMYRHFMFCTWHSSLSEGARSWGRP